MPEMVIGWTPMSDFLKHKQIRTKILILLTDYNLKLIMVEVAIQIYDRLAGNYLCATRIVIR